MFLNHVNWLWRHSASGQSWPASHHSCSMARPIWACITARALPSQEGCKNQNLAVAGISWLGCRSCSTVSPDWGWGIGNCAPANCRKSPGCASSICCCVPRATFPCAAWVQGGFRDIWACWGSHGPTVTENKGREPNQSKYWNNGELAMLDPPTPISSFTLRSVACRRTDSPLVPTE